MTCDCIGSAGAHSQEKTIAITSEGTVADDDNSVSYNSDIKVRSFFPLYQN